MLREDGNTSWAGISPVHDVSLYNYMIMAWAPFSASLQAWWWCLRHARGRGPRQLHRIFSAGNETPGCVEHADVLAFAQQRASFHPQRRGVGSGDVGDTAHASGHLEADFAVGLGDVGDGQVNGFSAHDTRAGVVVDVNEVLFLVPGKGYWAIMLLLLELARPPASTMSTY